jgi:outer membrane receptor protein involved in Fe transport
MGAFAGGDTAQLADAADFNLTTWGAAIADTHVFRPNLVNEFKIGFSRFDLFAVPKDMQISSARELGIPGVSESVPPFSGGLPAIRPTGFAFLGANTPIPSVSQNTNYQLNENLTWIRGKHSMKFGFQVVRRHLNFFESQDPARGFWNFNAEFTNNTLGAGGSPIASFLLGFPTQITRATLFGTFGLRGWENSWYAQDDFKVSRKLILNLGLRYELFRREPGARAGRGQVRRPQGGPQQLRAQAWLRLRRHGQRPHRGARLLRPALRQRPLRRAGRAGPQHPLHADPELPAGRAVRRPQPD